MNQSEARVAYIVIRRVAEMPRKGVDQGAAVIAVTRVYDQSGRFVHHQEVIVFIHYVERDIFGNYFEFIAGPVHHHRNHIVRLDPVV